MGSRSTKHDQRKHVALTLVTAAAAAAGAYALYQRLARSGGAAHEGGLVVRQSITIDRPVRELYRFSRDLANLPRLIGHLESVRERTDGRSRWTAQGPAGVSYSWDAELVDDREDELIAWRSVDDAQVPNEGFVRLVPRSADRTEMQVSFSYRPLGRQLAAEIAKLFGEAPAQRVRDALRRLKQELETGTVITSAYASPSGRSGETRSGSAGPVTVTILRRTR